MLLRFRLALIGAVLSLGLTLLFITFHYDVKSSWPDIGSYESVFAWKPFIDKQPALQSGTFVYKTPVSEDKVVVVAKTPRENVTWFSEHLPDWQTAIYHMDETDIDPTGLKVPANKGHEAMAYLTFIIDHYDTLPSTIAFMHAHHKGAWHIDAPNYDSVFLLRDLRLDFVHQQGYVNLRCQHDPGCPAECQTNRDDGREDHGAERAMHEAWRTMFGAHLIVPDILAAPCCAQFAVSRDQIRQRELAEYVRYRDWLLTTELDDYTSGRVFETLVHIKKQTLAQGAV
ncbi:hypothetical protein LTS07_001518 [Exophiala sideris]|uniref:Uncharacterized protein n=1 Tax=Exophiala sideris TaxID=1016849 RepID=A0ABR0JQE9_9EURO|nr:hypothetical protein LTS07_001518 [Exophiala sideris]KAK5044032.1 hypothetical protein LTR13_000388 [Exophiala sideris]KAK5067531.1 hypothetical protein LTR69_001520 [Exophiala sideris]KAK5184230.1 hypothetical protein LTR44_003736 [Eurotiomycetes sp. CCFEE 6388]